MMNHLINCLIAMYLGLLGSGLHAGDRLISKKAISDFISAENSGDRGYVQEDLFENLNHVQLLRLRNHCSDDIAVEAAYQVLLKSEQKIISRKDGEIATRYQHKDIGRFMGFLEGRLKTEILSEWEECLARCTFYKDGANGDIDSMSYNLDSMLGLFSNQNGSLRSIKGQSLVQIEGKTFLDFGKQRVPISKEFLQSKFAKDTVNAFGTIRGGHCIILFISDFNLGDYVIVSLDPQSGTVQWKNKVWSSSIGGASGLPMPHSAVPVINGAKVFVFGVSGGGIYLECFNIKNGEPLLRFGTDY